MITVEQLYAAGLSCEEVSGFRKAMRHPSMTDNLAFRPDEPMTGARLDRFRRGAAIAIRWRTMYLRDQRDQTAHHARERAIAGSARMFITRRSHIDPLDLLHHAIGRGN